MSLKMPEKRCAHRKVETVHELVTKMKQWDYVQEWGICEECESRLYRFRYGTQPPRGWYRVTSDQNWPEEAKR